MYRLFIAIDPPEKIRSQIRSLCYGLNGVNWESEYQIHLTLRFIGDADGLMLEDIFHCLSTIKEKSFSIRLKGLGHFPPRGMAKVLWVGIGNVNNLEKLHRIINSVLSECGLEPEHRKFSPHITLGRVKKSSSNKIAEYLSHHSRFKSEPFIVHQFHLYTSKLTPKGAIHEKLASFPLV